VDWTLQDIHPHNNNSSLDFMTISLILILYFSFRAR
jgi:hypothetical protein